MCDRPLRDSNLSASWAAASRVCIPEDGAQERSFERGGRERYVALRLEQSSRLKSMPYQVPSLMAKWVVSWSLGMVRANEIAVELGH